MNMRISKEEGDFRGIGLSQRCHTCLHKQEQEEKLGLNDIQVDFRKRLQH